MNTLYLHIKDYVKTSSNPRVIMEYDQNQITIINFKKHESKMNLNIPWDHTPSPCNTSNSLGTVALFIWHEVCYCGSGGIVFELTGKALD